MVSRYPAIQLMGRSPLPKRVAFHRDPFTRPGPPDPVVSRLSRRFQRLSRSSGQVSYVLRTRAPLSTPRKGLPVRLACVRHAANVHPEPGSNSPFVLPLRTSILSAPVPGPKPVAPAFRFPSHSHVVKLRPGPPSGPPLHTRSVADPHPTPPTRPLSSPRLALLATVRAVAARCRPRSTRTRAPAKQAKQGSLRRAIAACQASTLPGKHPLCGQVQPVAS